MIGPYQRTGQNVYDVRGKCEDESNLCYSALGYISEYLNRADVMKALGAEVSSYDSCNFDINRNFLFQGDWMQPFHRLVPGILEQIPVLIYAGDADFICNWLGNQGWTEALEWPGQKDFNKASIEDLKLDDGKKFGKVKTSGNFTFMQIFGAGHMGKNHAKPRALHMLTCWLLVPMDQPEASLDFLNRWIGGEWY
jgi:cathepsin A (carboxypeptidase C)